MVFLDYLRDKKLANKSKDYWQKVLIEMLGVGWKEQEYIIGYKPKTAEKADIGLNYQAGAKWPTKIMPKEKWDSLEQKLSGLGYSVSWQEGLSDLNQYMDWINSCRVVISQDSLGIHLALAFKKIAIGLFGPTDPQEVYDYGNSKILHSRQKCPRMPCYSPKCLSGMNCMANMELDRIVDTVKELYGKPERNR